MSVVSKLTICGMYDKYLVDCFVLFDIGGIMLFYLISGYVIS